MHKLINFFSLLLWYLIYKLTKMDQNPKRIIADLWHLPTGIRMINMKMTRKIWWRRERTSPLHWIRSGGSRSTRWIVITLSDSLAPWIFSVGCWYSWRIRCMKIGLQQGCTSHLELLWQTVFSPAGIYKAVPFFFKKKKQRRKCWFWYPSCV